MLILFVYLMILILGFCYSNLTRETGRLELASTITLVLQANRLTKCASHPNDYYFIQSMAVIVTVFLLNERV